MHAALISISWSSAGKKLTPGVLRTIQTAVNTSSITYGYLPGVYGGTKLTPLGDIDTINQSVNQSINQSIIYLN